MAQPRPPRRSEGLRPPRDWGELSYQPAMWYGDLWPRMRAFALPSFAEGYVRVNLAGREREGIVPPEPVRGRLRRDGGAPPRAARRPHRAAGRERGPADPAAAPTTGRSELPDADLVVCWNSGAWDVVNSPAVGRIGPVPFGRTGSHVNRGFIAVRGAGRRAWAADLADGRVTDVAATILDLAGRLAAAAARRPPPARPRLARRR